MTDSISPELAPAIGARLRLPNPPIGAGSLTIIGAVIAAGGVFVAEWIRTGDVNTGLAGLFGALVSVFFGGRSYQAGQLYRPVTVARADLNPGILPLTASRLTAPTVGPGADPLDPPAIDEPPAERTDALPA